MAEPAVQLPAKEAGALTAAPANLENTLAVVS